MSRLGPSFMKIRTWSGSQNAWTQINNVNVASRLSNFRNLFVMIQMISCHDCWPWTKPGYTTMTQRQSNNQWSGSIAAHPIQKNSDCKNPLVKFLPRFFGIKKASSSLIIFQRAKLSTWSVINLCSCNWGHFEGKMQWEGLVLAWQCPGSRGTCNPEETSLPGLPVSRSPTLFSGSGPVGLPPVPWTKNQLKVRHFLSDAEVIAAAETWLNRQPSEFFFGWLAEVRATG